MSIRLGEISAYVVETCLSVPSPSELFGRGHLPQPLTMSRELQGTHPTGCFSHLASMILGNTPWLTLKCLGTGIGVVFPIFNCPSEADLFTTDLTISLPSVAIPLKSELAYEIFDKGQVRFWLQAEHLSPDASFRFVINDREVSDSEVSSWM